MHIRGKEIRKRYVTNRKHLSAVANPEEFFAYTLDGDSTFRSAMSFMTGLYPGDDLGPKALFPN